MKKPLLIPFLILLYLVQNTVKSQDFSGVPYGPDSTQFVDIYIAPSPCPTPVYFDAHGNGGTTVMPSSITNSLKANGISIVAWESLTSVNTPAQVQTGWNDADLMFAWVKANAATYNFDTTQFIIGGSSRGSILSWKYGHSARPEVKGLYMYNALPSNVWVDSTWWYPPNEVKVTSPPVFFVYRREPGSSMNPTDPDIHDPNNGFIIMDTYEGLGIGDRDTLIHSIRDSASSDKYQFLLDFALPLLTPCGSVGINDQVTKNNKYSFYPNPFNQDFHIEGLEGKEQFILTDIRAKVLIKTENQKELKFDFLEPGMYFLNILSSDDLETISIVKEK